MRVREDQHDIREAFAGGTGHKDLENYGIIVLCKTNFQLDKLLTAQ